MYIWFFVFLIDYGRFLWHFDSKALTYILAKADSLVRNLTCQNTAQLATIIRCACRLLEVRFGLTKKPGFRCGVRSNRLRFSFIIF